MDEEGFGPTSEGGPEPAGDNGQDERHLRSVAPLLLPRLPEDWERALCVVAHPDDLEYGASSAVARWTSQGKQVVYLLASRGEAGIDTIPPGKAGPVREGEQRAAAAAVGVETVEFLTHRDGQIEYSLRLRQDIARAIRRHRPEVLVSLNFHLTFGGGFPNQADHRAVGLATLDASRDAANRWVYPELTALELGPWDGVRMVLYSGSPNPTHAVDVTGFLDKGISALREHAVYLRELGGDFDPEAFLRQRAVDDGRLLGCEHAVTFEVFEV
jgi:LmbE family N-acetylglucosaminyl deacetylase